MKNLKKIVCLILALAMCMGLAVTAFAGGLQDFPDAEEVTYPEHLDLMVSIGIIDGINGELKPKDTVTREQAAKMIAYMRLGKEAADALPKNSVVFGDVEKGRWSAGYIAYCAASGIIHGVGDTNQDGLPEFEPTGKVTGNQFMKMLLSAVGYGVKGEFTGAKWAINTASCGYRVGAYDGSKAASYDGPATREEAMLYACNVLTKVPVVSYSEFGGYYSGKSPLEENDSDSYLNTLGYKTYKLHKVDGTDVFGRPYTVWELNNKPMGQKQYKEAAKSLAAEISSGELYTALGREFAGDARRYVNGEEMPDFPIVRNGAEKIGGRGIQTFVYTDEDTRAVTLISIPTYLGIVTKVSGQELTVMVCDGSRNEEANMSGSYAYDLKSGETFSKNDRVLVCVANNEIQGIMAAESFRGVLEASNENYHKVDGKTYYKAATFGGVEYAEYAGDYTATCTFYTDSFGNLYGDELYQEGQAVSSDYLYVLQSELTSGTFSQRANLLVRDLNGKETTMVLNTWTEDEKLYYSNCGTKTEITSANGEPVNDLTTPGFYLYSKNRDGSVTLKSADAKAKVVGFVNAALHTETGSKKLTMGDTPCFGSAPGALYLNDSSRLHVLGKYGSVTTVTGYGSIRGYSEESVSYLVFYSGNTVKDLYVFDGNYTEPAMIGLYTGESYRGGDGLYYTFLVDGKTVDRKLDVEAELTEDKLYSFRSEEGSIVELHEAQVFSWPITISAVRSGCFTAGGEDFYFDRDTAIYDITDNCAKAEICAGDTVVFAMNEGVVVTVYILER